MANHEHLKWLKEGVEAWNRRRQRENFKPNLFGVELSSATLNGVDFRDANLRCSNLKDANLDNADLTNAALDGADLQNANLSNTTLVGAHLRHATLIGVNLLNAQPWQARLYLPLDEISFLPYQDEVTDPSEAYQAAELDINKTKIDDIACLLGACRAIGDKYQHYYTYDAIRLYFRGESRCSWELRPSAMRSKARSVEGEMLLQLMSRRAQDFSGVPSALAQWVLAQHHGLPTRLLDITRNPLVALFHACDERDSQDKNGCLHIFAVPKTLIKPFNSDAISIITNFAKLSEHEQSLLLGRTDGHEDDYHEVIGRLYHFIREEKPYFKERIDLEISSVYSSLNRSRPLNVSRAQSGAFLLSAFHQRFERNETLKHVAEMPIYGHFKLKVPHACKSGILHELRLFNITRGTLFLDWMKRRMRSDVTLPARGEHDVYRVWRPRVSSGEACNGATETDIHRAGSCI